VIDAPVATDAEGIAELRTLLDRLDYTAEGIPRAFGEDSFTRDVERVPLLLRRLQDGPLATLIKLFLLDVRVAAEEAEAALDPLPLDRVEAMGILRREGEEVWATVNLYPTGEQQVIASDQYDGKNGAGRPDHVLGPSLSSRVLAALTLSEPVTAALDLGTGSGIQALTIAEHATWVIATDVNPRAIRFVEFNKHLNGIANVETREGSAFDPVEGSRFGLIVANPPYVISPEIEYVFRDSGRPGDTFSEELVRRLPEFLIEGGWASILVEWAIRAGEDWSAAPRRWVAGCGCDVLLLHYLSQDPLSYAAIWNHDLRHDPGAYAAALDRWVEYDRTLEVDRIGWGGIVMRKRTSGPDNWVRAISSGSKRMAPAEHHIRRIFGAQDYIGSLGIGNGLLHGVFALADDHRFEQSFTLSGGRGNLEETVLKLRGGLMTEVELDRRALAVVGLLDGRRPLGDVVREASATDPELLDPGQLAVEILPGFVRLLELGLVVPASS
jgi:hypothetical protein